MTDTTPLHQLNELGQSVWLDSISREWLDGGDLTRMLDELAIVGVTSNPSIFEQALRSDIYDAEISRCIDAGDDDRTIFEKVEVADLQRACDVLAGVHAATQRRDGMVSIELEPDLAMDTEASVQRARHLWAAVDRPNLMIKVPATEPGLPVIERLLREGINVNVTLLFSVDVYRQVMQRYVSAIERRDESGLSLEVASVASFFVSRVDTAVDAQLPDGHELRGKIAVANAVAAWAAYQEVFTSDRWKALEAKGAHPQRPLWASTGTKNAQYSDVLYVQELIVTGTVNTMPLATLTAFADHGEARVTIDDAAVAMAEQQLAELAQAGVDLADVTETLREQGVASFQSSYDELISRIAAKRAVTA